MPNWFRSNRFQIFCKIGVLKNFTSISLWILLNFSESGNELLSVNRTWELFFLKNHAKNEAGGLHPDFFLPIKRTLQKIKASDWSCRSQGLKLYKKKTPSHVFSCQFCTIFSKTLFTEHFWMNESADSSVFICFIPLSHLLVFSFIFSLLWLIITIMRVHSESI